VVDDDDDDDDDGDDEDDDDNDDKDNNDDDDAAAADDDDEAADEPEAGRGKLGPGAKKKSASGKDKKRLKQQQKKTTAAAASSARATDAANRAAALDMAKAAETAKKEASALAASSSATAAEIEAARHKAVLATKAASAAAAALNHGDDVKGAAAAAGSAGDGDASDDSSDEQAEWSHQVDIKIENFSVAVPGRTLLKDTSLTLAYGVRYGLAGPNGTGKSTLLGYIARREGAFKAIPKRLLILYVEQEVRGDDTPALESVMESDKELISLLNERDRLEADENADGERLAGVYDRLAHIGADQAKARASAILHGLQFEDADFAKKTREFSGGWRMRLALARALFMRPDILLLDEPTNHLDLYAVIWLEHYLSSWKKSLLVVSHDRDFLNHVVNQTICIYNEQLYTYKGDYDSYDTAHKLMIASKRKALEKQQKELIRLKTQVSNAQSKATAQQAKGASKAKGSTGMNRREGKGAAGGAASKEALIAKMETIGKVEELPHDYEVEFDFPDVDDLAVPIIQVKNASFGYEGGPVLFNNVDGGIDLESKIALIGANGSGKTTLMNVLMGKLMPVSGEVNVNRKLRCGLFRQHFVDQVPMDETPIGYLTRVTKARGVEDMTAADFRTFLGRFGLKGKTQTLLIAQLSGGQKSRLVLADIALRYPHVLFLDEPTNHLDIESVDALNEALQAWEGGLVLVTHDGRLIDKVCNQIWIMNHHERRIDKWSGTFEEYRQKLIREKFADMLEDEENTADKRREEELAARKKIEAARKEANEERSARKTRQ
jgi:ATP-binding cassette subfamily F protein 1